MRSPSMVGWRCPPPLESTGSPVPITLRGQQEFFFRVSFTSEEDLNLPAARLNTSVQCAEEPSTVCFTLLSPTTSMLQPCRDSKAELPGCSQDSATSVLSPPPPGAWYCLGVARIVGLHTLSLLGQVRSPQWPFQSANFTPLLSDYGCSIGTKHSINITFSSSLFFSILVFFLFI